MNIRLLRHKPFTKLVDARSVVNHLTSEPYVYLALRASVLKLRDRLPSRLSFVMVRGYKEADFLLYSLHMQYHEFGSRLIKPNFTTKQIDTFLAEEVVVLLGTEKSLHNLIVAGYELSNVVMIDPPKPETLRLLSESKGELHIHYVPNIPICERTHTSLVKANREDPSNTLTIHDCAAVVGAYNAFKN